jgi:hypothetical protein
MLKLNSLSGFGSGVSAGGATATNGYSLGGNDGSRTDTSDKLVFATDVMSACTDANLATGRDQHGSFGNQSTHGYVFGGKNGDGTTINSMEKITYATDTVASIADVLSTVRNNQGGQTLSDGSTYGYTSGGRSAGPAVATCDRTTYADDTTAAHTDGDLSEIKQECGSISADTVNGYITGGNPQSGALGWKMAFSTGTMAANTDCELQGDNRQQHAGLSDQSTNGYWCGGNTGGGVADTSERIVFSTDTTSTTTDAGLSNARGLVMGMSSTDGAGYIAGGWWNPDGWARLSTTDKLTYSTETFALATDAEMSSARYYVANESDGAY